MMNGWSLLERAFGWSGVIAYHGVGESPDTPVMHVSPRRLRSQLEHLRKQHRIVPLRKLVERWHSRVSTNGCVAITFDDAYAGVLVHALPILRAMEIPATVFIASDHAQLGASYWWDDVARKNDSGPGELREAFNALGLREWEGNGVSPTKLDQIRDRVLARFAGR